MACGFRVEETRRERPTDSTGRGEHDRNRGHDTQLRPLSRTVSHPGASPFYLLSPPKESQRNPGAQPPGTSPQLRDRLAQTRRLKPGRLRLSELGEPEARAEASAGPRPPWGLQLPVPAGRPGRPSSPTRRSGLRVCHVAFSPCVCLCPALFFFKGKRSWD